jgi:hypothetical protein
MLRVQKVDESFYLSVIIKTSVQGACQFVMLQMEPTRRRCQMNFDTYAFSRQPGFVETEMRKAFKQAVPLRTVVVYCYDPRAVNIPHAVAKALPGEVYPGEIVRDEHGKKIASTSTIFPVVVAGGRTVDALLQCRAGR